MRIASRSVHPPSTITSTGAPASSKPSVSTSAPAVRGRCSPSPVRLSRPSPRPSPRRRIPCPTTWTSRTGGSCSGTGRGPTSSRCQRIPSPCRSWCGSR
ncbi:hypothetical protein ACFPRL_17270 [Pseudoclavibacter helvolus]